MELQNSITKENVRSLMILFYKKAIQDEDIGHFFTHELGHDMKNEDWDYHIGILTDFWLAILLNEDSYKGKPFGPHFNMHNLKRESFMKWIKLFSESADEIYAPKISERFKKKGISFSKDFMNKLML